jgi:hypothetical protein
MSALKLGYITGFYTYADRFVCPWGGEHAKDGFCNPKEGEAHGHHHTGPFVTVADLPCPFTNNKSFHPRASDPCGKYCPKTDKEKTRWWATHGPEDMLKRISDAQKSLSIPSSGNSAQGR